MATKRTAKKLNTGRKRARRSLGVKVTDDKKVVPAFTRATYGGGNPRQVVAIRLSTGELEMLEAMADKWQVSVAQVVRESTRRVAVEEKILVS
jgi:uncharacterized protein (DUF4415 family)